MLWGIDPGGRKVAVACPERKLLQTLEAPATYPRWQQLRVIGDWVASLPIHEDDTVMVESAIQGGSGNVQVTVAIAGTVGAVQSNLPVPSYVVAPSSWKAYVLGFGSASKPDIAAWLAASDPALAMACGSQDLIDACCIAYSGTPFS